MSSFTLLLGFMALGRVALGLAPFVAAGPASRLLGFPPSHDNATSRLMARLFGVRDVGLGVLVLYAIRHPEAASFIFLFNAATDAGDAFSAGVPLLRRDGIDRGAGFTATLAGGACIAWLLVWRFHP